MEGLEGYVGSLDFLHQEPLRASSQMKAPGRAVWHTRHDWQGQRVEDSRSQTHRDDRQGVNSRGLF